MATREEFAAIKEDQDDVDSDYLRNENLFSGECIYQESYIHTNKIVFYTAIFSKITAVCDDTQKKKHCNDKSKLQIKIIVGTGCDLGCDL